MLEVSSADTPSGYDVVVVSVASACLLSKLPSLPYVPQTTVLLRFDVISPHDRPLHISRMDFDVIPYMWASESASFDFWAGSTFLHRKISRTSWCVRTEPRLLKAKD